MELFLGLVVFVCVVAEVNLAMKLSEFGNCHYHLSELFDAL